MSVYSNGSPQTTSAANPPRRVTGQYLAKNKLSESARLSLAWDILEGNVEPSSLCVSQVAELCRVPPAAIHKLRSEYKKSAATHAAMCAASARRAETANDETLAHHMERCSPAEWQQAACIYGIDRIWDHMIAPVLAEEQQAAE